MCGIFGVIQGKRSRFTTDESAVVVKHLFLLSESRGKEASGLATISPHQITICKLPVTPSIFLKKINLGDLFTMTFNGFIGHSRLATNGDEQDNNNNQPVYTNASVGVHNGMIINDIALWKEYSMLKRRVQVDTEIILALFDYFIRKGINPQHAITKVYQKIEGAATIALCSVDLPNLILATNTSSLYYAANRYIFVFASERYILEKTIHTTPLNNYFSDKSVKHLVAGAGLMIHLTSLRLSHYLLTGSPTKSGSIDRIKVSRTIADKTPKDLLFFYRVQDLFRNSISKLSKHEPNYESIKKIHRCTKCIFPETMPFISFDGDGVCSYCREHRKIEYKGRKALEKLIEPYRSKDGEPDCIIAFSGGRDSSYGLHYLKKELGLNPIAFTYDWGMVTDLARRNQARIAGKLGVEHVVVSADITMKRTRIRNNIRAWIKNPNLGMVPLFMQGDKQCEFYIDRLARRTKIKLVFFCRGNEFEREEFKTGHCGVKDADPGGVIHDLALWGKAKIAVYYGLQYLKNPAYINSSSLDTLSAYFISYIQKHNYIFLWHYIPWDEKTIIKILTS